MLRLSELYTSSQGEGPGTGQMTQFIRFGGCNLRCEGWPCDTPYAVDPAQYRNEWEKVDVTTLVERVASYPRRVVFTGGEPFLQPAKEMNELAVNLFNLGYNVEIFTNGTMILPNWVTFHMASVIMDWKLPGSGEDCFNGVRIVNLDRLGAKDAVKFVIKDRDDFDMAVELFRDNLLARNIQVYAGVVWGTLETSELVEWIKHEELDWKINVQVHNIIWNRSLRGI